MTAVVSKDIHTIGNIRSRVQRILKDVTGKGMVITEEMYRGKGNFAPFYKKMGELKNEADQLCVTLNIKEHSGFLEKYGICSTGILTKDQISEINTTLLKADSAIRKEIGLVKGLNSEIKARGNIQGNMDYYQTVCQEVIKLKMLIDSYIEAVKLTYKSTKKETRSAKVKRKQVEIREFLFNLKQQI